MLRLICASCAWGLTGLALYSSWRQLRDGVKTVNVLHRIPCSRCRYFTQNYDLKCSVNPIAALTLEAIDCRDFEH